MRDFDFIVSPEKLLTPEIVQMVSSIHEHKGKQELFLEANVDELKTLLEVALIQSTGASNRIEGIFTSDKRLEELVSQKAEPRNRSEQEIAGYREVLSTIHEGYEYINPRPNIILQLHRDLYSYSQGSAGGSYKNSDNVIAETDAEGHQKARFIPVPAFQTAEAMEELCARFLEAWEADRIDKLVLIPMFILDFLCIHPFNDGNGRMSRLLTLLLFYKAGYIVGKYISMEMLIEKTKETMFRFEGPDFPYEEFRKDTSNRFHEIEETEGLPVKKGARELLSWLKESGANVGLASSTRSETVIRQLTHAGLIQYFDVIVGGEMAKKSKPEPDIYLEACKRMGITPESAYGVEDSYNGMRSLHAAGLHPIMVPDLLEPNEEMQSLAEIILPDLLEVRDYLKNVWNNR